MNGKIIGVFILLCGAVAGAGLYYQQVYAYYTPVTAEEAGMSIVRADGSVDRLEASDFEAIDADTSPIRFRACLTLSDPATVLASGMPVAEAVPLNAPRWFDCFDAARIGEDLASGAATAILWRSNVIYGIDRVLAVYPDGRAFAWQQINACGEEVFDGRPAPEGCPPRDN